VPMLLGVLAGLTEVALEGIEVNSVRVLSAGRRSRSPQRDILQTELCVAKPAVQSTSRRKQALGLSFDCAMNEAKQFCNTMMALSAPLLPLSRAPLSLVISTGPLPSSLPRPAFDPLRFTCPLICLNLCSIPINCLWFVCDGRQDVMVLGVQLVDDP